MYRAKIQNLDMVSMVHIYKKNPNLPDEVQQIFQKVQFLREICPYDIYGGILFYFRFFRLPGSRKCPVIYITEFELY